MSEWENAKKWALLEELHRLDNEIRLLDEAYGGYFPEPSAQLDAMNELNDEWERIRQELGGERSELSDRRER